MTSEAWANFFLAQCGASAALVGLLFVSVSLNLAKILSLRHLPERALLAMALLLTILIVAMLMLMPGQSMRADAIEALAAGALILGVATRIKLRDRERFNSPWRRYFIWDLIFLAFATLPYLVAGVLLLSGVGAGFYWLAAAMILSTAKSVTDAWVLLVEINR